MLRSVTAKPTRQRRLFLFVVASFLLCIGTVQADTDWQTLKSKAGKFSILMPAKPKLKETSTPSPVGRIPEEIYEAKTPQLKVIAEYSKLPSVAVFFGGHKTILKKSVTAFIQGEKGTLQKQEDIELQGFPGTAITFTAPDKTGGTDFGKAHFYLVKKLLYVLVAKTPKAKSDLAGQDRFLNSFKLKHK